ncbi:MAG: hypothetical protein CCU26_04150 [Nitrospira sp. UW-LDO-01]|nr:MAG: hypothetical protein CCU26_04150 [Nitrospira sp. UW-LDO-01]
MNPGQMRQADGSMPLFEITARGPCGPHGGHSVDRASSLLYEITHHLLQKRGLNTSFALQPIYPEEHCPQSTSLWQLNSYRLLFADVS